MSPSVTIPITSSPDDARVFLEGGTYPPTGTATASDTDTSFYVLRDRNSGNTIYRVHLGLLRFDTSVIPDDAVIQSAALQLTSVSSFAASNADGLSLVAEYYSWTPSATSSDYTVTASNTAHSGTSLSTLTAVSTTFDFALQNLSSIDTGGYTGLRVHVSGLSGGAAPTDFSANYFGFWTYDAVGPQEPRLIVTYTLPNDYYLPTEGLGKKKRTSTFAI